MITIIIAELMGFSAQAMIRLIKELTTADRLHSGLTGGHHAIARHEPGYFAQHCRVQDGWSWSKRMRWMKQDSLRAFVSSKVRVAVIIMHASLLVNVQTMWFHLVPTMPSYGSGSVQSLKMITKFISKKS